MSAKKSKLKRMITKLVSDMVYMKDWQIREIFAGKAKISPQIIRLSTREEFSELLIKEIEANKILKNRITNIFKGLERGKSAIQPPNRFQAQ